MLGIEKGKASVRTDRDGWANVSDVCDVLKKDQNLSLSPEEIRVALNESGPTDLMWGTRGIRLRQRTNEHPPSTIPDILYHATTATQMANLGDARHLGKDYRRTLYFSVRESHAWRVAHRLGTDAMVLYVDATRAARHGARFKKNKRNGLYMANQVPIVDILNLQKNFAEQLSAGGFPIRRDDDGRIRLALIQVKRRSGISWEVAKGKLEPGETPEVSACRETAEEMGVPNHFRVNQYIDTVRYGFMAPGRLPRLKTVFLYLLDSDKPVGSFTPATKEGIQDVKWYTIDEAERVVKHTSLIPVMRKLLRVIHKMEQET